MRAIAVYNETQRDVTRDCDLAHSGQRNARSLISALMRESHASICPLRDPRTGHARVLNRDETGAVSTCQPYPAEDPGNFSR